MEVISITNLQETIIEDKTPFKFSISNLKLIKESVDPDNPDGPIQFEGLASTTEKSGNRNKMMQPAIQKMKDSAKNLPIFWDHDESRRAASIINVKSSNKSEFWPIGETAPLTGNTVLDAPILQVKRDLDDPNCEVGMSIGGMILKAKFVEDIDTGEWWIEIEDIDLYEVSLTTVPALEDTKGKTKILNSCKGSICSQIVQSIRENKDLPISEALKQRLGQSKDVKLNKPKMEKETMTEDKIEVDKTEWKQMQEAIKTASEYIQKDIEAKKKAEKDKLEKEAREEIKKELKEEVTKEFVEEVIPSLAEATNKAFDQKIAKLMGERNHVQQSATGATKPEDIEETQSGTNPVIDIIEQRKPNPASSIAENHKSVVLGNTVKGYTPTEMFGDN